MSKPTLKLFAADVQRLKIANAALQALLEALATQGVANITYDENEVCTLCDNAVDQLTTFRNSLGEL